MLSAPEDPGKLVPHAMQLRHLRYFTKIVEAGSFSRAASMIHVAQPALSQQIGELEEELGVRLLQRSARGVRPTVAGETLYREASSILRLMDQLPGKVRSAGGEAAGTVNLGVSSTLASFLAGPFMEGCRAALPRVALRFITGDSAVVTRRIEARTLDLGIVFEDEALPGMARRILFRQRLFLVRREPPAQGAEHVSLDALAARPLVLPVHPNVTRSLLDRVFADAGLVPSVAAEADTLFSILSAVQSGIGDTILPKGDLSDVPGHAGLHCIPIAPPIHLSAAIVAASEAPLTGAGEAVRNFLAEFVALRLAESKPPGAEWIGERAP